MSTNFPTSLDTFVDPSSSNYLSDATVLHSTQHVNLNDSVAALEAKVGVNSSAVTSSLDYKISNGVAINPVSAYSTVSNNTNASAIPAATQQLVLGTPGYTASGYDFAQWTASANSYAQVSLQNSATNASASTDIVVTADNGTDSTHYADFGINSSIGGTTPFANANAAYLYSTDNEVDIAALGSSGTVKIYTTGGTSAPVLAATFDSSQNTTLAAALNVAGEITASASGAASAPTFYLTGSPYAAGIGTTAFPMTFVQPTGTTAYTNWTTTGTVLGANMPASYGGDYIRYVQNATPWFIVSNTGNVTGTQFIGNASGRTFIAVGVGGQYMCRSDGGIAWTTTTNAGGGTIDAGIDRAGTNLLELNGGTIGTVGASLKLLNILSSSAQTTINGASSGSAVFSQPHQGASYKKVVIYCNALLGATTSYTFPTAFINTPAIMTTNGLASSIVTTLTTTGCVVTGATSTGFIFIEGY